MNATIRAYLYIVVAAVVTLVIGSVALMITGSLFGTSLPVRLVVAVVFAALYLIEVWDEATG